MIEGRACSTSLLFSDELRFPVVLVLFAPLLATCQKFYLYGFITPGRRVCDYEKGGNREEDPAQMR